MSRPRRKRQPPPPALGSRSASPPLGISVSRLFTAARAQHEAGRLAEAECLYNQIMAVDPRHADSLHLSGVAAGQAGNHDLAGERITRAIAIQPGRAAYHVNLGHVRRTQKRPAEAVSSYRRAVELRPDDADALCSLGKALRDLGRLDEAVASYRRAIDVAPACADAHNHLGAALAVQGKLAEAEEHCRRAVALTPADTDAHRNLGAVLTAQGRLTDAEPFYRGAATLRPSDPRIHTTLANLLRDQGRLVEALPCYQRAADLRPDDADAHHKLGHALRDLGRVEEAVPCYRRAIALKPDHAGAHGGLGGALREFGQFAEAFACCERAVALRPDRADFHNNLGNALFDMRRLDESVACYRRALDLRPDFAQAYNNLGAALGEQQKLDEAVASHQRALQLTPDNAGAWSNLGTALRAQGRLEESTASYRRALALNPDYADAHMSLGMTLLAQGNFADGWREYEWRWKTRQLVRGLRNFGKPQWWGEPAAGSTVLIHAEQGFGDTLQFCRYAPLVAARGLRVVMEVQPQLKRLLGCLPGVTVLGRDEALPAYDLHCPMMSLPLALGTSLDTIPGPNPYLSADPAGMAAWRARLEGCGLRVGLVWAGNPRRHNPALEAVDRRRSIAPERLVPLFAVPGVQLVSLQKEGPKLPAGTNIMDPMEEMWDFYDSAGLIANLDLLISVDTATAHLAAALGRPVWLLDRFDACWRWLTGRRDSPWYPSLRLYRQRTPADWDSVVAEIAADLRALSSDRSR